jgi:hypothetical protein
MRGKTRVDETFKFRMPNARRTALLILVAPDGVTMAHIVAISLLEEGAQAGTRAAHHRRANPSISILLSPKSDPRDGDDS